MRCASLFDRRSRFVAPAVMAIAACLLALLGISSQAFAEGGTVRYSYERVDLPNGERYALVPVGAQNKLHGKVSKSTLFDAFNLLKSDKSATYGHSSIRITGRFPGRAKVSVKIDPSKRRYASIIMAETVYTLAEYGVDAVEFPGYYDGAMRRADVPFSAYTLTVPLWRALPLEGISPAQVRLPDGTLISSQEFAKRWKAKDEKLRAGLFSYLNDGQAFTVNQVLGLLPKLDVAYADKVTPLLSHKSVAVRTKALHVLEDKRNNDNVLAAVLEMMNSDKNAKLARAAAEFLGKAKADKYNIEKDLFLIERGTEDESAAAATALSKRKKDQRAVEALYAHLSDKRAKVAHASADGLEAMGADKRQIAALDNTKVDAALRLDIAGELAAHKDEHSRLVGLTYVAHNTKGRSAEMAIRKIAKLKDPKARTTVESFLQADTRRKRLSAGNALVQRGKVESLAAFAKAIKKGDNADQLEEQAYSLMVAQPLKTILEQSDSHNAVVKRLAYRALGERAVKEHASSKVFDKLVKGAKSSDAAIRGASARALGAFANTKTLAVLKTLADDKSADVRTGVAHGLSHYKNGQMFDTLAKYLNDSSPEVVAAALDAMAARKEATKWDQIKDLTDAKDPQVRASALAALSKLVSHNDAKGVQKVISLLSGAVSDDNRTVQLTAIHQLATFDDAKATTGIAIQLNAADNNLRVAAIEALGKTGNASATELVVSVLDDPNPDIRRAAIEALGNLADKSAESKLKARLDKEKDPDLKKLIKRTLRKI